MKNRLYNLQKPIIGVTGGIATGKTTVCNFIKESGELVLNADHIVKEIYQQQITKDWLQNNFHEVIDQDKINFSKLRKLFFSDSSFQEKIENFIYPKMKNIFLSKVDDSAEVVFYDVPLLFEKKLNEKVDCSLLIYCNPQEQIRRVCKRDNIDENLANKIIEKQIPINDKKEISDYVFDNSKRYENINEIKDQILSLVKTIKENL